MSDHVDAEKETAARLVGASCTRLERNEAGSWVFTFGDGEAGLVVDCPWRIVAEGRIALAREDHGRQFGLPAPIDGVAVGERLLSGKPVTAVSVRRDTADLAIMFGGHAVLELFNASSGYESWNISCLSSDLI